MHNENKKYYFLDLFGIFFVALLMLSNFMASAKIVDFGISILGYQLIISGGTLLFPLCLIIGDILTEVYGFNKTKRFIWVGFVVSLVQVAFVYIVKIAPGEENWLLNDGQNIFDSAFYGIYSGGLVIASLAAYLVGEFSNSIILAKMKIMTKGKHMYARFLFSTIVGQSLDSLVFVGIATLLGVFPSFLFLELFITSCLFKILLESLLLPISTKLASVVKKAENIDHFDYKTKLNPFFS